MSVIDTLKALAITVRNEKKKEANSAIRIGDLFLAIIDFIKGLTTGQIRQEGVDTYNDTSGGKTSLLNTYSSPQIGWTVLVRKDETNGGKASLYNWNGSKWINLETPVYNEDVATKAELKSITDFTKTVPYCNFGSQYIGVNGRITLGAREYRGYTKFIKLANGLKLTNISAVNSNYLKDKGYAYIMLYDSKFNHIGNIYNDLESDSLNFDVDLGTIITDFPKAYYLRANVHIDKPFSISLASDNIITVDDDYVNQLFELSVSIYGGNYVAKDGTIVFGALAYRGYSKMIKIANLTLRNFSITTAQNIESNKFAGVILYDNTFKYIGYVTIELPVASVDGYTYEVVKADIIQLFPKASYFRVNLHQDYKFRVDVINSSELYVCDESFVEKIKLQNSKITLGIYGGNYVGNDGAFVQGVRTYRGYSKMIRIADMTLKHFAITNAQNIGGKKFAGIILYDKDFVFIGHVVIDLSVSSIEDYTYTIVKNDITNIYPRALYFRVNLHENYQFSIELASNSELYVCDEGFVNQVTLNDRSGVTSRQILNPVLPTLKNADEFKMLLIGSSWLNDTAAKVRDTALASGLKVEVGNIYMSGVRYDQIIAFFKNNTPCNYFHWDSVGSEMTLDQIPIKDVLMSHWDVIVIQQSAKETFYWETYQPYMREWIQLLKTNTTNPNVFIAMNHPWTPSRFGIYIANYGFSSQSEMWDVSLRNITRASHESGIDLVIPCGMAIYSLRTTSLQNNMDITRDHLHLDEGIGTYCSACTVFESILKPVYGVSVLGNTYRDTLQASVGKTPVTDLNAEIVQRCAVSACANRFGYTDMTGIY